MKGFTLDQGLQSKENPRLAKSFSSPDNAAATELLSSSVNALTNHLALESAIKAEIRVFLSPGWLLSQARTVTEEDG